jgi:phage terminase Nu1 subunit (DNA packaging protein)
MITKDSLTRLKQVEIAALLDRDERTVQRWHDDGLPRHGTGRGSYYVWAEVRAWDQARLSGSEGEAPTDKEREQCAKADLAEMEAARMRGTLMDSTEARNAWQDFLARIRANLRDFPKRLIPLLEEAGNPSERLDIARKEMDSTLRDLVAEQQRLATGEGEDGPDE